MLIESNNQKSRHIDAIVETSKILEMEMKRGRVHMDDNENNEDGSMSMSESSLLFWSCEDRSTDTDGKVKEGQIVKPDVVAVIEDGRGIVVGTLFDSSSSSSSSSSSNDSTSTSTTFRSSSGDSSGSRSNTPTKDPPRSPSTLKAALLDKTSPRTPSSPPVHKKHSPFSDTVRNSIQRRNSDRSMTASYSPRTSSSSIVPAGTMVDNDDGNKSVATESTSLSKLDRLRARNDHLRRCSSQQIASVRQSLKLMQKADSRLTNGYRHPADNMVQHQQQQGFGRMQSLDGCCHSSASMRSVSKLPAAPILVVDPQERLSSSSSSAPQLQWDESTVETFSSRTLGLESFPPSPAMPQQQQQGRSAYRHSGNSSFGSLPVHEVVTATRPEEYRHQYRHNSSPSLLHHSLSLDDDTRSMLQEENQLLKRQVSLLMEQKEWDAHVEQESQAVHSLRQELQTKKERRQRRQWKKRSIRRMMSLMILAAVAVCVWATLAPSSFQDATSASLHQWNTLVDRIHDSAAATLGNHYYHRMGTKKKTNRFGDLLINMKHDTLGVWLEQNRRGHGTAENSEL